MPTATPDGQYKPAGQGPVQLGVVSADEFPKYPASGRHASRESHGQLLQRRGGLHRRDIARSHVVPVVQGGLEVPAEQLEHAAAPGPLYCPGRHAVLVATLVPATHA